MKTAEEVGIFTIYDLRFTMSKELQTLILAYRVVFLDREQAEFRKAYEACDPERLMKLAGYHAVRPVLYQALKKTGINDALTLKLQLFASQMAMRDKLYGKEVARLLKLLNNNGIETLPYKGYLFTEKLYEGQHFRESGDMDLVIRDKRQAAAALRLLMKEGYVLQSGVNIEKLLDNAQGREVSLVWSGQAGLTFHVDFHWGVNESYNPYPINEEDYFRGAYNQSFFGGVCLLPSTEAFFKMLLNHHGGRELWFKLKELFDLSLFIQRFPGKQYPLMEWAGQVNMKKIYETGAVLHTLLITDGAKDKLSTEERVIINVWEKGESYRNRIIPKLKRLFVYFRLQDENVNQWTLFKRFISFHASYNPVNEFPRPFGPRLELLNFLTKLLVILYKRAIGTYKTT